MKINDLRKLKDEELKSKLTDLSTEYLDKKFSILNNSLSDTSVLQKIRKDTARIRTIINERKNHE
jgi:ribosomal protein L29